ncbi:transmembrane protein 184C-like isoform X2 [Fukomys damarensis]|nr:transmembrane protein 184C-like isoform X2 [Fukomys damarensis]
MYCLILFYSTLREELKPLYPIGKFLCVTLVIFVSFWQGVIIAILVKCKVISRGPLWDWQSPEEVAIGLQYFLVCLEMFVAGIAHHHVFSHKPYVQSQEEGSWFKSFLAMWDFSNLKDDLPEQISHMGWTISRQHKPKNHTEGQDEKIPTGGQDEKQHSPSLPPTSEDGLSSVSALPRAVTHHTAHTVINMPEVDTPGDTPGAKKCEYIALTIPDEVVSDSTDDTSETGEDDTSETGKDEAVKEVQV